MIRKLLWRLGIGCSLFIVAVVAFCWYIGVFGGNIRVVSPGHAYRSAQLSGDTLESVLRRYNVKTVVNLRGGKAGEARYDSEIAVSRSCGASVVDIPLSATHLPPPTQIAKLVALFKANDGPLLIHCAGGSDRSGLASTIYRVVHDGLPLDRAEAEELTWRYGHFPVGQTKSMDDFFDLYRRTESGLPLDVWITQRYPQVYRDAIAAGER